MLEIHPLPALALEIRDNGVVEPVDDMQGLGSTICADQDVIKLEGEQALSHGEGNWPVLLHQEFAPDVRCRAELFMVSAAAGQLCEKAIALFVQLGGF
jgi:hypothetical protein